MLSFYETSESTSLDDIAGARLTMRRFAASWPNYWGTVVLMKDKKKEWHNSEKEKR